MFWYFFTGEKIRGCWNGFFRRFWCGFEGFDERIVSNKILSVVFANGGGEENSCGGWVKVGGVGWSWVELGEGGWSWMELGEVGWSWMELGGVGLS